MTQKRPSRPSHTTVVAYLALFVALTGTAIAGSGKIGPKKIKKGAVKSSKIAKEAVKKNKLADGAVVTEKLAGEAVKGGKLAPESVGTNKLQTNAVKQKQLANGSVGTAQLLSQSVGNGKLKDNAVTGAKVENGSLRLVDYARVVVNGTPDPPSLAAHECATVDVAFGGLQAGDLPLVLTPNPAPASGVQAVSAVAPGSAASTIAVLFCNGSGGPVDADPTPVRIALLR